MTLFIFLIILGYLMGSICSAIIVCKACSLPDPRLEGSKNPGATNVLRLAGKQYAALVMIADILKGTIPVLIAQLLGAGAVGIGFTALAAVVGHMYPAFFEFKGGKGVATAVGTFLGIQFMVGILVAATWLLVAKFSRYSSLASIAAICLAPIYTLLLVQNSDILLPLLIMALLILYKHKDNITRLIDKTEPKITLKQNVLGHIMEDKPPVVHHKPVTPPKTKTAKPTATKETAKKKKAAPKKPASSKTSKATKSPKAKKE